MKQNQGLDRFAKIQFSKIDFNEVVPVTQRRLAMQFLLKNGYVAFDSYAMAELIRFVRALQELKLEYSLRTIDRNVNNANDTGMLYEFTLAYFEDDRENSPITTTTISSGAITTKTIATTISNKTER